MGFWVCTGHLCVGTGVAGCAGRGVGGLTAWTQARDRRRWSVWPFKWSEKRLKVPCGMIGVASILVFSLMGIIFSLYELDDDFFSL